MAAFSRIAKRFFGGFYAWSISVFFGAVLLDVVYSRLVQTSVSGGKESSIFHDVSDFLLLIGGVMVLSGFIAVVSSWNVPASRNLFALSLLVVGGSEIVLPNILLPVLRTSAGSVVPSLASLLRLLPILLASFLAIVGLQWQFPRDRSQN